MKKQIVKIDAAKWYSNRNLRLCSPAARGFLVDLKCLSPGGRLVANGIPLSEEQIASLTGASVSNVKKWMQELAAADAYDVDGEGLYFADMVRKVSGAKPKKSQQRIIDKLKDPTYTKPLNATIAELPAEATPDRRDEKSKAMAAMVEKVAAQPTPPKVSAPAKKAAAWYKTDAGWWRKAQELAISKGPDEDIDDFKLRVAMRLPDGPHLDFVPAHVAKEVRAAIVTGKEAIKAAIPESLRGGV